LEEFCKIFEKSFEVQEKFCCKEDFIKAEILRSQVPLE